MQLKEVQFDVIFTLIWNAAVRQAAAKKWDVLSTGRFLAASQKLY
jgi:hypothetical protein